MPTEQTLHATLEILQSGGWIEQTQDCPIQYSLRLGSEAIALPGHIVQRLLVSRSIKPTCKVSGRMRYVLTAT
ncbi:MAG: hypothetical protein RBR52_14610 [Thiomonas sp.]|uniref:hypothetical protein n=1 Tax=Thiomonas sp. TaxID=2047785 RepID=UPI002A36353F|nr:hypothetical protein [Thiomonas sp.]MDY0331707.1 hypothetical protein [Thiomonas sp.]